MSGLRASPSWPGPAGGRPFRAHTALAWARPSHPREPRRSRDPAPRMPETLQGPRRPLAPSQDALAASAPPPGWGSSGQGPCVLSLYSPRPRLKAPPTPLPQVLSSDVGSASLPFPVVSSVRQTLSTPGGALPPRLPQTSASLGSPQTSLGRPGSSAEETAMTPRRLL